MQKRFTLQNMMKNMQHKLAATATGYMRAASHTALHSHIHILHFFRIIIYVSTKGNITVDIALQSGGANSHIRAKYYCCALSYLDRYLNVNSG